MGRKNLWKYSGIALYSLGILHTLVAVAIMVQENVFAEFARKGVWNSTEGDCKLGLAFWFFFCGIVLLLFGFTLDYYIRRTQTPAPRFFGWGILFLGCAGFVFEPVSGFPLIALLGLFILLTKKCMSIKNDE